MWSQFPFDLLFIIQFYFSIVKINGQLVDDLENPVVKISNGAIRGTKLKSRNGIDYHAFLGIPYGQAERFGISKPPENWDGIRNASEFGEECIQNNLFRNGRTGSENCLFLNVYTPMVKGVLPVIFWIHGGGFMFGSGNLFKAKYFMDEQVVLVTINYRLSVLGFLDTQDGTVQGNLGLKDQNLALRWVNIHIHAFGGDNTRVTIFGSSAGGASANLHMISSSSAELFQRSISQSGSGLAPWVLQKYPRENAMRLAEYLNCPTEPTVHMVKCLKYRDAQDLIKMTEKFKEGSSALDINFVFTPTVETHISTESFLKDCPLKLLESGKVQKGIDWIVGFNSEDGIFNLGPFLEKNDINGLIKNWNEIAPWLLLNKFKTDDSNLQSISQKIQDFYFELNEEKINEDNFWKNLSNCVVDRWTTLDNIKSIQLWTELGTSVYPYIFSFTGNFSYLNSFFNIKKRYGVGHWDELQYLFNELYGAPEYENTTEIGKFSQEFVKLWTSFASNGIPRTETMNKWSTFNKNEPLDWFKIDNTPDKILTDNIFDKKIKFWDSLQLNNCPFESHKQIHPNDEL